MVRYTAAEVLRWFPEPPQVRRRSQYAGFVRPFIVRAAISFWNDLDADIWANQRLIVKHVQRVLPRADKDTVRAVIDQLSRHGIFVRKTLGLRRTIYRLGATFSDPTASGFARHIDELLHDPVSWVSADGQFYRIGRPTPNTGRVHPIPTKPHYFAKHAWMRSWTHALEAGLFERPTVALRVVTRAAREAPVRLLLDWWRNRSAPSGTREHIRRSNFFRPTRRLFPDRDAPKRARPRVAMDADDAFRVLYALSGHSHMAPLLGDFVPLDGPPPAGIERRIYVALDGFAKEVVHAAPEARACRRPDEVEDFLRLERAYRSLPAEVQTGFPDHRRAWRPPGIPSLEEWLAE